MRFVISVFLLTFVLLIRTSLGAVTDTVTIIRPGVVHTQRVQAAPDTPQVINLLVIDLTHPSVSFHTELGLDVARGRETIPSQASSVSDALAAINGDFSGFTGATQIPQNICVQDGELITSPSFRTGVGIQRDNTTRIGFWLRTAPPAFSWPATLVDQQGNTHTIIQQNQDCNGGWMCVYTDRYNDPPFSRGGDFADEVEAVVDSEGRVVSIHDNGDGMTIPKDGYVLIGRGPAGDWILNNVTVGESLTYNQVTIPDFRDYENCIGGGPRIVRDGEYYADPIQPFNGVELIENFTLDYKNTYYNNRHPRTAIGVSEDGKKMIWAVIDGRQNGRSGMTLEELAELMIEFGSYQATSMDGGGSSILWARGQVLNSPSDGSPRPVTNSLVMVYDADVVVPPATGPYVSVRDTGPDEGSLTYQVDSQDDLNGNVAEVVFGGWHPINDDPADQQAAFTDGNGLGGLAGLLRDFPGENIPALTARWDLGGPSDLSEIRVFSGNADKDGRVFHHYDVYITSASPPTSGFFPLIEEVTPTSFGETNDGGLQNSLTVVSDAEGGAMANGVTGLEIRFYSVSNTAGAFRDDWNGGNGDDAGWGARGDRISLAL